MISFKPKEYIVDESGKKTHVVLSVEQYESLLEWLEDLEDIKIIDDRMKNPEFMELYEVKRQLGL